MGKDHVSRDELNNLPKEALITMFLQMSSAFDVVNSQLEVMQNQNSELLKQVLKLQENIAVMTQQRFGRQSERNLVDPNQLSLDMGNLPVLNEAETLTEDGIPAEDDAVIARKQRKRRSGKRAEDLSKLEKLEPEPFELSEEELAVRFPNGYTRLTDEISFAVEHEPAKYLVHEYHVAVYAGKDGSGIVRAPHPNRLLKSSILTPSLAAAVFNGKYVNSLPLNRQAEEFQRNDLNVSPQVLAGWMIRINELYLGPVIRRMWEEVKKSPLIHCDETPFKVVEDKTDKSYMWVYHANSKFGVHPVFIYSYNTHRNTDVVRNALKGYCGTLMTDGYQVYHTLNKEQPELHVAGCWAHTKRKFADLVKSLDKKSANGTLAADAVRRIQTIYHVDNMMKDASAEERLKHRQTSVRPLVDAYFAWLKDPMLLKELDKGSATYRAVNYSINQEQYLRAFLDNPVIPLDNNDAERSIKSFCVGKHNWHIAYSRNGADASGNLYSIAETAKACGLKPYNYFEFLLTELLKHMDDAPSTYIDDIMPWSDKIPDSCRKLNT